MKEARSIWIIHALTDIPKVHIRPDELPRVSNGGDIGYLCYKYVVGAGDKAIWPGPGLHVPDY